MDRQIAEGYYPLTFRQEEAQQLGKYLQQRRSVNLIGMRRVGISNFLRFFLHHKDIVETHISFKQKHLFIPIDLNDLVEREIYPFWTLTLKRIVDACEAIDLPDKTVDNTVCIRLMHHIYDKEFRLAIYKELQRVSNKTVCISYWVEGNYKSYREFLRSKKTGRFITKRNVRNVAAMFLKKQQEKEKDRVSFAKTIRNCTDF